MTGGKEIISLKDVRVVYDGRTVLEEVTLSIKEYDFLGLIGPNGGGKTTLLKVILGLITPIKGEVKIFGNTPVKTRKFIGYVPQAAQFDRKFPISVWEVVLMGRLAHRGILKKYTNEDKRIAEKALDVVEMPGFKNRQISQLSGGQQQRIFIARALATKSRLLLLDEPAAGVDTRMQDGLYRLLNKLRREVAIVLVSHDIGVISSYVDKIACLNRQLFYHDSKQEVIKNLEQIYDQCPIEMLAHRIPHRVMKEH